jgi:hypothetical protein
MTAKDARDANPPKTDKPETLDDATVVREVVPAIREERIDQININVLLQCVTEKHEDPDAMIARTEKMLELVENYEQDRLKAFTDRANAIIGLKTGDPDLLNVAAVLVPTAAIGLRYGFDTPVDRHNIEQLLAVAGALVATFVIALLSQAILASENDLTAVCRSLIKALEAGDRARAQARG